MIQFLYTKCNDIVSVLRLSEQSDANCSRSTNASKLVIDFLDEPLEKQTNKKAATPKWFACPHMKTLWVEESSPIPLSAGVERHFSSFFAQSEQSCDAHFQLLVFLKRNQYTVYIYISGAARGGGGGGGRPGVTILE